MTRTIEILISPKGETTVQTKGFTGGTCRDASKLLEQALGQKTGDQATAEFYAAQQIQQTQQAQR